MIQEMGAGGLLGAALQFFRARKAFPEWAFILLACFGALFLAWAVGGMEFSALIGPQRAAAWMQIAATLSGALSGTQITSSAANIAVAGGFQSSHPMIPVTNSK